MYKNHRIFDRFCTPGGASRAIDSKHMCDRRCCQPQGKIRDDDIWRALCVACGTWSFGGKMLGGKEVRCFGFTSSTAMDRFFHVWVRHLMLRCRLGLPLVS